MVKRWLAILSMAVAANANADAPLEARVQAVAQELRCLVCQNQSIADSDAELAVDLRQQVREQLARGLAEAEVTAFMVERYGDFVLYRPPLKSSTWPLWFGPLLALAGGLGMLVLQVRRADRLAEDE